MIRIGLAAAVLIIVVASIFFGFRKAARDADAEKAATSSPTSTSTSTPPLGARPESGSSAVASSAREAASSIKRIDPAAREKLLAQIQAARARRAQPATPSAPIPVKQELSDDYIRTQVSALIPLLNECYSQALEDDPELAGQLTVSFTIGGEPEIGGLVETSEVDATRSTIAHAGMVECVRETMYGVELVAPAGGGRVEVRNQFEFRPD